MADTLPSQTYNLRGSEELRIEAGTDAVYLTLVNGAAEIFGAELDVGRRVCLHDTKIAVFCWEGCTVRVEGTPIEPAYTSDDTPMVQYLNLSHVLNNQRDVARDRARPSGPCVALIGPVDVGKTSLAKILINYAIRSGWAPALVDTDVGQGMLTAPGCVAASTIHSPVDPEEGLSTDAPAAFFYGHTSPATSPGLYKLQVDRLAELCEKRLAQSSVSLRAAGTLINTLGWVEGQGRELQEHVCRAFNVSTICVIGDEKLHSSISLSFKDTPGVEVIKLPKSAGCVSLNQEFRKGLRDARVQEYFYGRSKELTPHTQMLPFASVKLYKVTEHASKSALLPAGGKSHLSPLRAMPVDPSDDLVGMVLGVSYAEQPADVMNLNVAGFVWVLQVDMADSSLTVMCPHASPPPGSIFLVGSVRCAVPT